MKGFHMMMSYKARATESPAGSNFPSIDKWLSGVPLSCPWWCEWHYLWSAERPGLQAMIAEIEAGYVAD